MGYIAKPQTRQQEVLNNIFIMDMLNLPAEDKTEALIILKMHSIHAGEEKALQDFREFINYVIDIERGN